jgi:hypothetical protein
MGDEVLARLAALIGMAFAGEGEGALNRGAINRLVAVGRILADDGEQVAEQGPLIRGQVLGDVVDGRGWAVRVVGADLDVAARRQRLRGAFPGY